MIDKKIRCFIAVEIPDNIKNEIDLFISDLRKISPQIKWVKTKGMHITLKFLGEIEPEICDQVKRVLSEITNITNPFEIKITESGAFPNFNKPRVFWIGLQQDKNQSLNRLNEWIETKLSVLGFERERRKFSPHITLGRVRNPGNFGKLTNLLKEKKISNNIIQVSQIVFMKSELKPTGAVYTPIEFYKL